MNIEYMLAFQFPIVLAIMLAFVGIYGMVSAASPVSALAGAFFAGSGTALVVTFLGRAGATAELLAISLLLIVLGLQALMAAAAVAIRSSTGATRFSSLRRLK